MTVGRARISRYALPLVLEEATGEVRGVFGRGLDVVRSDGRLLFLGGGEVGLSCTGAELPAPDLRRLLAAAHPGDAVRLGRGLVELAGGPVADLAGAEVVDLACTEALGTAARRALLARLQSLSLEHWLGLAWDDAFRAAAGAVARADEAGADELDAAVRWLYGRGSGLTPTGDDVLCGVGLGLALAGRTEARTALLCSVRRVAQARSTTYVSEAYLRAMAAGQANECVRDLVEAARQGRPLSAPLARARKVGHTSGDDLLFGLSLALA